MKVKFYDGRYSNNPRAFIGFLFEKELERPVNSYKMLCIDDQYYKVIAWRFAGKGIQLVRVERINLCIDDPEPMENDCPICPVCRNVAYTGSLEQYEKLKATYYCENCGAKLETEKTVTYTTSARKLPKIREVQQ